MSFSESIVEDAVLGGFPLPRAYGGQVGELRVNSRIKAKQRKCPFGCLVVVGAGP